MKKEHLLLMALTLLTVFCWLATPPLEETPLYMKTSQLLGALSLLGFALLFFTAGRFAVLDAVFDGMDKAYSFHKRLGVVSLLLVAAHIIVLAVNHPLVVSRGVAGPEEGPVMLGWPSLLLFVILVLFAFIARKLKYEPWKAVHAWLLLPYIAGLVHYYRSSEYAVFAPTAFSLWLNVVNLTGLVCAFYSIFIYEAAAFPYRFRVARTVAVANGTLQITGERSGGGSESPGFTPGQFIFVKFRERRLRFPSHPFTVSDSFTAGNVQFTVKNLGDHTARLVSQIKPGDEFSVSRPRGRFNFRAGKNRQIWIAGGIGVAPFRSFIRSGIPETFKIDLFYAYDSAADAPYLEELGSLPQGGSLRVHLIDYTEKGYLQAEYLKEAFTADETPDVYFCGPKAMGKYVRRQLSEGGLAVGNWREEEFRFR